MLGIPVPLWWFFGAPDSGIRSFLQIPESGGRIYHFWGQGNFQIPLNSYVYPTDPPIQNKIREKTLQEWNSRNLWQFPPERNSGFWIRTQFSGGIRGFCRFLTKVPNLVMYDGDYQWNHNKIYTSWLSISLDTWSFVWYLLIILETRKKVDVGQCCQSMA